MPLHQDLITSISYALSNLSYNQTLEGDYLALEAAES